jgi:hypothetical protein
MYRKRNHVAFRSCCSSQSHTVTRVLRGSWAGSANDAIGHFKSLAVMSGSETDASSPLLADRERSAREREPAVPALAARNLGVGGLAWVAQGGLLLSFVTLWVIVVSNPAGLYNFVSRFARRRPSHQQNRSLYAPSSSPVIGHLLLCPRHPRFAACQNTFGESQRPTCPSNISVQRSLHRCGDK